MTDHDALLRAVLAAPEDDLPRLVFADFLEESGEPANVARAHYIRVQIEAERFPESHPERSALTRKGVALRGAFSDEADVVLPHRYPIPPVQMLTRRRGFVDEVRLGFDGLSFTLNSIMTVAPVMALHINRLTDVSLPEALSGLARIRRLTLGPVLTSRVELDSLAARGFRLPDLNGLTSLVVAQNSITDNMLASMMRHIHESAFAPNLRDLNLSHNALTDRGARTLIASDALNGLTRLDLRHNQLTAGGAAALQRRFGDRVRV